ncbi:hypothetical protein YTPLAS18_28770 [Nitrospira sp.]|nr:hypothetical protein YTPLAS18_28770 [Nitrospira sp.]
MRNPGRVCMRIVLVVMAAAQVIAAWYPSTAGAEESYRSHRWEVLLSPQYTLSRNIGFQGGTNVKIEDSFGFGIQIGYNFNDHVNLGGLFSWSRPDYQGTAQPAPPTPLAGTRPINGTIETSTFGMVLTYNVFKGPLTPYLDALVAGTYVDTDIVSGPPVNGCFWYPWYGYICGPVFPTKHDTFLAYGFGAGLRWDVNPMFLVRGGFRQQFVDISNTGTPSFSVFRVDVGFKF